MTRRNVVQHRKHRGGAEDSSASMVNVLVLVGMVLVLVLIYYYMYMDNQYTASKVESFTDSSLNVQSGELVVALFYADWCPHCVKFKPTWDGEMTPAINGMKTKSGKVVRMVKINCEENKALATKYGIDGYPTIKIISMDAGKETVEEYHEQRNKDAMITYLNSL